MSEITCKRGHKIDVGLWGEVCPFCVSYESAIHDTIKIIYKSTLTTPTKDYIVRCIKEGCDYDT